MWKKDDFQAISGVYILYAIVGIICYGFIVGKWGNKEVSLVPVPMLVLTAILIIIILLLGIFLLPIATKNLNRYKIFNVIAFVITELVIIYSFVLFVLFVTVWSLINVANIEDAKQLVIFSVFGMVFLTVILWVLISNLLEQKCSYYKHFYAYKRAFEKHFDFTILSTVFTVIVATLTFQNSSTSTTVDTLMSYTFTATLAVYTIKHGFRKVFSDYEKKINLVMGDYKKG